MLKSLYRIFRGSHLLGGYSITGRLKYLVSSGLDSRVWFDLYLGAT